MSHAVAQLGSAYADLLECVLVDMSVESSEDVLGNLSARLEKINKRLAHARRRDEILKGYLSNVTMLLEKMEKSSGDGVLMVALMAWRDEISLMIRRLDIVTIRNELNDCHHLIDKLRQRREAIRQVRVLNNGG